MITKKQLLWIIIMAVIYVLSVKYYAIAPITNIISSALFGWELAEYI